MQNKVMHALLGLVVVALVVASGNGFALAENIDPDDDGSQYGYGENVGWLNAEPLGNGGPGVQVEDTKPTGYIWAENIGWISLSCENTGSCATVDYRVTNDGSGNLSGYGWGENVGWISFSCENTSSCTAVDYGVTIDAATGLFEGYGWGENIGWISFSCGNTSSCAAVDYGVVTSWPGGGCTQGDCNEDAEVTSADVTCTIIEFFTSAGNACADCNGDGSVTSADVTCTILCIFDMCP